MKQKTSILRYVLQVVALSSVYVVILYLMVLLSSCHALVIADKLVYQGTLGKKQAAIEYSDSTVTTKQLSE